MSQPETGVHPKEPTPDNGGKALGPFKEAAKEFIPAPAKPLLSPAKEGWAHLGWSQRIALLIVGGLICWAVWHFTGNHYTSIIADKDKTLSEKDTTITHLGQTNLLQGAEIGRLITENEGLKTRAAILMQLPADAISGLSNFVSFYRNESTNREQLLAAILGAFTNTISDQLPIPAFQLYANDMILTNGMELDLTTYRALRFTIANVSTVTADRVNLSFQTFLDPSHLSLTSDWRLMPQSKIDVAGKLVPADNHWLWGADLNLSSGSSYNVSAIILSTNMPPTMVPFRVTVYASRSKSLKIEGRMKL
jgi:hypothetical protein